MDLYHDLVQMGPKKRPRLLPPYIKMYVFIEKRPRKTADCPYGCCYKLSHYATPTEEMNTTKALYSPTVYESAKTALPKQHLKIHPKKRLLKRFLQNQNCWWFNWYIYFWKNKFRKKNDVIVFFVSFYNLIAYDSTQASRVWYLGSVSIDSTVEIILTSSNQSYLFKLTNTIKNTCLRRIAC